MTAVKAYYNEHDKQAAAWLRELIKQKIITDGVVDERSIEDVLPAELVEFDRCHFFAGIGVWDYALTQAGWGGGAKVWTGSCPCQPFSSAGKGEGFDDERHLWPAWFHLIEVGRPDSIFGEQVSSSDGITWLDLVLSDLEGIDYTVGTLDIPSASVGAPHRRQRLYFVAGDPTIHRMAHAKNARNQRGPRKTQDQGKETRIQSGPEFGDGGRSSSLADAGQSERRRWASEQRPVSQTTPERCQETANNQRCGGSCIVEHSEGSDRRLPVRKGRQIGHPAKSVGPGETGGLDDTLGERGCGRESGGENATNARVTSETGPTNGFWRDAEWIFMRDERYRPIKPGTFPLADGPPGRMALLRGIGNAINPENAIAFIESYMEYQGENQ